MPLRLATLLVVAALTGLPAGAQAAPSTTTTDDDSAPRPFIERSLLLVPETAGLLKLVDVHVYERSMDGVGFRYQHPDFPGVRIDLFVYPRGRAERDAALAQGMEEMRGGIDYAAEQGSYTHLVYGESGTIDLTRVEVDGTMKPAETPDAPVGQTDEEAEKARMLAAFADGKTQRLRGLRLALSLAIADEPLDSRAYLFYGALYMFKGRISASPQQLPGEMLDRFADRAMADIVPQIEVRNTGGCEKKTIYVDPDATDEAGGNDFAAQLVSVLTQSSGESCLPTLDEAVPAGMRGTLLEIDPGMWNPP